MGHGIATVEIKKMRGKLHLIGLGKTPRGTKYIKDNIELPDAKGDPKKLKAEIAAAVTQMLGSD